MEQTQKQGLKNHCFNIKELMKRVKCGGRITADDRNAIIQFYLEVVDYLSKD